MRLRKFLDESIITREEIIKTLQKDCAPFLKEIGAKKNADFNSAMTCFYRGEDGIDVEKNPIYKRTVRSKRTPRGTLEAYFPIINEWLKKNGHVSREECAFTTSDKQTAKEFSEKGCGLFFPIGNYKYTFIRANDFNYDWDQYAFTWLLKEKLFKKLPRIIEAKYRKMYFNEDVFKLKNLKTVKITVSPIIYGYMSRKYSDTDTYDNWEKRAKEVPLMFETNKNLIEAYDNKYETWFNCKEYYLVNEKILFQI